MVDALFRQQLAVGAVSHNDQRPGQLLALSLIHISRQKDGRVLLRVEDLDTARCPRRYSEQMERDLQWLGLDWDIGPGRDNGTGPYYQSQRTEIYQACLLYTSRCV